jgi:succinate dehydrogenase / fumarate reductase, cytochrome b subunit
MNSMNTLQLSPVPSLGLKAAMAVSGLLMALWLTLHMLAIQLVFAGPALMNGYALQLRATGLLWPMRLGLLALLLVHVAAAVATSKQSVGARPERYQHQTRHNTSTPASRTMRTGGILLGLYILLHVSQMYGGLHPAFVPGDVHHNLVTVLRSPFNGFVYLTATVVVVLHLAHGLESALRSLGLLTRDGELRTARLLRAWALAVSVGFAIPVFWFSWGG